MSRDNQYQAMVDAYNHFHPAPLCGEHLAMFYVEELHQESCASLKAGIRMFAPQGKGLLIGPVGCGKSTMLNKIAADLAPEFHVTLIRVDETLNLSDIEVADVLVIIFLNLIYSLKAAGLKGFPNSAKGLIKLLKNSLAPDAKPSFPLLQQMAFKIGIESEARKTIRALFQRDPAAIKAVMARTFTEIADLLGKPALLLVDNFDILTENALRRLFITDAHLHELGCRAIYAFPLAAYLSPEFETIGEQYTLEFLNLTPVYDIDGKLAPASKNWLTQLVHKRIDASLIQASALDDIIINSGGLLNDLIEFMRNACKIAVMENAEMIDHGIAERALSHRIQNLKRFFYIAEHQNMLNLIEQTRLIDQVLDKAHLDLIKYKFLLKYGGEEEKSWCRLHPCLASLLALET